MLVVGYAVVYQTPSASLAYRHSFGELKLILSKFGCTQHSANKFASAFVCTNFPVVASNAPPRCPSSLRGTVFFVGWLCCCLSTPSASLVPLNEEGQCFFCWWLVLLLFIKLPPLRSSLFVKRDSIFIA